MDKNEQYIAGIIFSNQIYKYKGQQFEDFFVSVMSEANPNFQAVKAYGRIGDRKNDGFDRTTGTYYQVYAPEDLAKEAATGAGVRKIKEDLDGLYKNWNDLCPIKNFFFVVNDKLDGIPVPIIEMSLILGKTPEYSDIKINTFSTRDLKRVFDSLNDSAKQDILGMIPNQITPVVEYTALHEAVTFLMNAELPENNFDNLIVPDFEDKISFNGLSLVVSNLLVTGSYQEGLLTHYFNNNPGVKEILQKKFHALYEQSKVQIPDHKEHYADCRFYYILEQACPKQALSIQSSVLVLMAYYFSSCDIFEEPT